MIHWNTGKKDFSSLIQPLLQRCGCIITFYIVLTQSRSFISCRKVLTTRLAFGVFINPQNTAKAIHSSARARSTLHSVSGLTRFEILISSTLTKLMCRDGCNYKHNMECNHPIMIGDTWESVSNRVCSLIF